MKVGDYVRNKKGIIGKIKLIDNQTELYDLYLIKNKWYKKEEIIKSSPNIIDLIEVGDYVNGFYVINKPFNQRIHTEFDDFFEEDIKTILTKEQFSSMEYKVGE